MGRARGAATWALLALLACSGRHDRGQGPRCQLGQALEVTRADAVRFDGLALTVVPGGVLAVWSELSGTYGRLLDAQGKPRAARLRIHERCGGGLALAAAQASHGYATQGAWLACSRPSATSDDAPLELLRLSADLTVLGKQVLGSVGRDGQGVALAVDGPRLLVAFHDGTLQAYVARMVVYTAEAIESVALSDPAFAAGAPSIVARDGHWIAAFSETRVGLSDTATRLVLRSDQHAARVLRETGIVDPAPVLAWDDRSPWLAFRDRSPKNPKPELFAARLTSRLTLQTTPSQIGRANSDGMPSILACPSLRLALLPRDYASERYIGVHALDADLRNVGAGHQYYTNSREFVAAAGACVGDGALIVSGERTAPAEPGASLMALPFACTP